MRQTITSLMSTKKAISLSSGSHLHPPARSHTCRTPNPTVDRDAQKSGPSKWQTATTSWTRPSTNATTPSAGSCTTTRVKPTPPSGLRSRCQTSKRKSSPARSAGLVSGTPTATPSNTCATRKPRGGVPPGSCR